MEIQGEVRNGVVVLDSGYTIPEGTSVVVSIPPQHTEKRRKRIELPLVPSDQPGSVNLTAQRVAELLEQEDASG